MAISCFVWGPWSQSLLKVLFKHHTHVMMVGQQISVWNTHSWFTQEIILYLWSLESYGWCCSSFYMKQMQTPWSTRLYRRYCLAAWWQLVNWVVCWFTSILKALPTYFLKSSSLSMGATTIIPPCGTIVRHYFTVTEWLYCSVYYFLVLYFLSFWTQTLRCGP